MRVENIDTSKIDETVALLESMYNHRKGHPTTQSDLFFRQMQLDFVRDIRNAEAQGRPHVITYEFLPIEIIRAMGAVPSGGCQFGPGTVGGLANVVQDALAGAAELGIAYGVCGGWRNALGLCVKGWFPRPNAIVSSNTCDHSYKVMELEAHLYGVPYFFVDTPYPCDTEEAVQYYVGELEELIQFLEDVLHRKMDWDKLRESVVLSHKMVETNVQIRQLLRAVPSPWQTRNSSQAYWLQWLFAGTPEGAAFGTSLLAEMRENVTKGRGGIPNERWRIMSLPPVPMIRLKVFDWLAKEHGATVVANNTWLWEDIEMDPSKPLEALARKILFFPIMKQIMTPWARGDGWVRSLASAAKEFRADGVIVWGNPGCRNTLCAVRMMKDIVKEETGLPIVFIDHDLVDINYTTEEQLKDKLDEFIELMEAHKS